LEEEACEDGIDIIYYNFKNDNIKGLYCDGTIGLNANIETSAEKACILAEELGHYHTTVGDIIDMEDAQNRKQERQARLWAYNKQVGLLGLVRAYEAGCTSWHDAAEFLNVTESFLTEAVECYREKYGTGTMVDDYYISFIPYLSVGKIRI
jgi:hypothetical protein